ncbi:MAG TPA: NADH-quinone oxidoreductase subunit NuoH [Armatimonadota bacterium]|nr:NADH-quinone oxidoreductase subunit NuoH [Armatimonadota bacterium]
MNKELLLTAGIHLLVAIVILGFILFVVMYMIWGLRRIMGFMQVRIGPNRLGWQGLLQTPADALKLLQKEDVIPKGADRWLFTIAPIIVFVPAYMVYVVMPFGDGLIAKDLNIGILYVSAITSIAVIGIVLAGWASNNKWSLLGAFRAAAQLVAYEVPMILALCVPVIFAGSLRMGGIIEAQEGGWFTNWFIFRGYGIPALAFLIYMAAGLAEVNHIPFDIMEAESELVAGFNVEYSGMKFALFFLEEFAAAFTICAIAVTLFFGGWHAPFPFLGENLTGIAKMAVSLFWFLAKTAVFVFVLMWIRATWPRVRVDQLMNFGWKVMIPMGLFILLAAGTVVTLGWVKL